MKDEHILFLQVLNDYIHGKKTILTQNVNIDYSDSMMQLHNLLNISDSQSLSGILYVQLKDYFFNKKSSQKDIYSKIHRRFQSEIYFYINRLAELDLLISLFKKEEIRFALFKGVVTSKYFPDPALRTMGDIDIVIHPEDREKSDKIMSSLGYKRTINNHAVWAYDKDMIEFEIHDHMFYEYLTNHINYKKYFDQVWKFSTKDNNSYQYDIPEEFHFIYIIAHMAKHIINNGMGFRAYLDLVFMCRKMNDRVEWEWIKEELNKLQLLKFTEICCSLCERWFNVKMPFSAGDIEDQFYEYVTDKIFNDGIFGLENYQNIAAHSAKEIKRSNMPYLFTAMRITINKIFPSYKDMQLVPWYRFVDGRPWIMPIAWVYRWFYCFTHKKNESIDLFTEPFKNQDIVKERKRIMDKWGL